MPGNLVVSPASVTTALAMAWGGARGKTSEEMQAVLRFDRPAAETMQVAGRLSAALTDPKRPVTFRIANRLFGEQSYRFEPAYLDATKTAYGAALEPLDFKRAPDQARDRINGWVEQQTERRIRDLVPPGLSAHDAPRARQRDLLPGGLGGPVQEGGDAAGAVLHVPDGPEERADDAPDRGASDCAEKDGVKASSWRTGAATCRCSSSSPTRSMASTPSSGR